MTEDERNAFLTLKKPEVQNTRKGRGRGLRAEGRPVWAAEDDESYIPEPVVQLGEGEEGQVSNTQCGEGFYYRRGRCRPCKKGCLECTRRNKCTKCANEEMIVKRGACYCPAGELQDDGTCGDCPEGQYYH